MWYLIHVDDGIIETAKTKKDIMINHGKSERYGYINNEVVYHVIDESCTYFLYRSKEQAIADGFSWVFEEN